ncbi:Glucose-6-phosphate isomerase, cytosolic [Gracilariopsis chorda]|uniref:Glucose-6-phosphate isomerase n=1 Tax=Gracilariopsis chorda TaxID=448386 RepID=A0A2V3ILY9_9FLOR|nr:Glucose-6-phosphate isomerase, cytosolic [Gracilariopsis chorda]|eukprot:PXF43104.1 Glucose-6-phosphate isomerase, cytosolic [Gracilariopsis chorda]
MAASQTDVSAISDALRQAAAQADNLSISQLLMDTARVQKMTATHQKLHIDYSRQLLTLDTLHNLHRLADATDLRAHINAMFAGEKINSTENRAVLHVALRAPKSASIYVDGVDVVPNVHKVLTDINAFTDKVRSGEWLGATGAPLTDVVAIGIGGSYLGPEFVFEALRMHPPAVKAAKGRRLRFLANVDPVDVARARDGLDPATTLIVVISKTFTTAETMLNARTMRAWIVDALGPDAVSKHMIAVSTNLPAVQDFGIDPANVFGFWDWVGGRYSVSSAVGVVPLSLQYGHDIVSEFLAGAHDMDQHFRSAPFDSNMPVLMGLVGVWNSTFLGHATRALLPYQQALLKLAPHIQQVDMESNGKSVRLDGSALSVPAGPINFGEPGTNGQHSFYQLIHQGRVVPCDFVGVIKSQVPISLDGEPVSNHDELMSNFFAQPDALAFGKSAEQCRAEGVPEELVPHKTFPGNRPSSSMLIEELTPFTAGQLLALFEHRTAVEGFIWGINSFDQWGVELGKVLAKGVRKQLQMSRKGASVSGFNPSTSALLKKYLAGSVSS